MVTKSIVGLPQSYKCLACIRTVSHMVETPMPNTLLSLYGCRRRTITSSIEPVDLIGIVFFAVSRFSKVELTSSGNIYI